MRSELLIGPNLTISHDAGREVTSLRPHAPGVSRVGNRRTPPITSRRGPREHCGLVCSHPTLTRFPWARQLTHRGGDTAADGLRRPSPISWIMGVMHRSPVRSNLYSVSPMSQQGKSRACPGGSPAVEPQVQHAMTAAAAASDAGVVSSPTLHGDGPGKVEVLVQPGRDGFPSTRIVGQPLGGR